jgi:pilus assembly protein CpaE
MPEGLTGIDQGGRMELARPTTLRGKVRLHAVVQTDETERALRQAARDAGDVELALLTGVLPRHLDRLCQTDGVDMLFVEVNLEDGGDMAALDALVAQSGNKPVIVTSKSASVEALRLLVRMPLADYLPQPLRHDDLVTVLKTSRQRPGPAREGDKKPATVISFIRPAGGLGTTCLAIQTAWELANPSGSRKQKKPSVCLVDLDFQASNCAIYLDLEPTFDLLEIARFPQRLDGGLLRAMTAQHVSGFGVLASPNQLVNHDTITADVIGTVLSAICDVHDYVVIDMPLAWAQWVPTVLSGSDIVYLVSRLSYPIVRQSRQMLLSLSNAGLGGIPLSIVANRYPKQFWQRGLSRREAERAVGRAIEYIVPDEERLVLEAVNRGVPIRDVKRNSGIEKAVRKMVQESLKRLTPADAAVTPTLKR